jgi:lipoyl(octanoyl) transferase
MGRGVLRVLSFGPQLVAYGPALRLQEALAEQRKADAIPDTLLLLQHAPVFTVGKRGGGGDFRAPLADIRARCVSPRTPCGALSRFSLLAPPHAACGALPVAACSRPRFARRRRPPSHSGIAISHSPRGGETTYHGPGQLVAYPVLGLRALGLGARAYVEGLEDALVRTLGVHGLSARGRVPGRTGVWVGERKVAAIGVRISGGVTTHGAALNVDVDLTPFGWIVPCGSPDRPATSMAAELRRGAGDGPRVEEVEQQLADAFARQFGFSGVEAGRPPPLPPAEDGDDAAAG